MYDMEIVKRAKAGDLDAFELLYFGCAKKVLALCLSVCRNEKAAYNAMVTAMLEIWDSFDFDLGICFDEWLYYCTLEKIELDQMVLGKDDYSIEACWMYILAIIRDNKIRFIDEEEWTPIFFAPEDDDFVFTKAVRDVNPAVNLFRIINQKERKRVKRSESI